MGPQVKLWKSDAAVEVIAPQTRISGLGYASTEDPAAIWAQWFNKVLKIDANPNIKDHPHITFYVEYIPQWLRAQPSL